MMVPVNVNNQNHDLNDVGGVEPLPAKLESFGVTVVNVDEKSPVILGEIAVS